MKRFLSVILTISIILSLNVSSVFSEEVKVFSDSFENGLSNLNVSGGDPAIEGRIARVETGNATDGKKSLYVYDESVELYAGVSSNKVAVSSLKKYIVSVDVYVISTTMRLDVRGTDSNGSELFVKRLSSSKTNEWETLTLEVSAIPGLTNLRMFIQTASTEVAEGYIDNLRIIDAGSPPEEELAGSHLYNELKTKISNAKAGDTIEIEDGRYNNIIINIAKSGSAGKPITIKAKNPGKAIFTGFSAIEITGSYITVDGLRFENCIAVPYIISVTKGSSYCTIKDCAILNSKPEVIENGQNWVNLYGDYHKVTGCYFRGKEGSGMMVEVKRPDSSPNYVTIENCYFGDYKNGTGNGFETIRIGTSDQIYSGSYSVIKNCFFESCNGEVEIVSIKSSFNKVLNNTFYNCDGAVYSRHGNNTEISGNLFIGGGTTTRDTGVVLYGENHNVNNNYFYNLPKTTGAVIIKDGNPHPDYTGHLQAVTNLQLKNNTVVACDIGFEVGNYSPSDNIKSNTTIPPEGVIEKNALISYKGAMPQIAKCDSDANVTYKNNYVSGKAVGYDGVLPSGIIYGNNDYEIKDGFLTFKNGVGADISEVKKAPENPFEIIPEWVKKDLYDTNIIEFKPVWGDFLNTSFKVSDVLPSNDKITVMINGIRESFSKKIYMKNSEVMVPVTEFFRKVGGTASVNSSNATANNGGSAFTFYKNSSVVKVGSKNVDFGVSIDYTDGEYFIPLGVTVRELCGYYSLTEENVAIININTSPAKEENDVVLPDMADGTIENPYLIGSAYDFIKVFGRDKSENLLNCHFKQTCDIILPSDYENLTPSNDNIFLGVYDGNGYSITLDMSDENKTGSTYGGLFYNNGGTIKNLTIKGRVNYPKGNFNGGFAAINSGTIENCVNMADITGSKYTGGLSGSMGGTVLFCANYGTITGKSSYAGGIAGVLSDSMTVEKTFNAGAISAPSAAGGIAGANTFSARGRKFKVNNCFNIGEICADSDAGIIIGYTGSDSSVNVNMVYDIANPDKDIVGLYEDEMLIDIRNSYILDSEIELYYGEGITRTQLNRMPSSFSSSVWGNISGPYPYVQFIEKDENGDYINKLEGDFDLNEFVFFDDLTNVKRVDNIFGFDYTTLAIAAAKYNKSSDVNEESLEYGVIATKDTSVSDLTVDYGKKYSGEGAVNGAYAITLLNVPDSLALRPYALYKGIYYYGTTQKANKPDVNNMIAAPTLSYENDYNSNVITVSWDVDSRATDYKVDVYADGVKLLNGYDESDIMNGKLYISNTNQDFHYSSVYKVFVTGIGDGSVSNSVASEIEIDNTDITGTGTQDDPYIIRSGKQFVSAFGSEAGLEYYGYAQHFKQVNSFEIADYTPSTNAFRGIYEGNGNKITIVNYNSVNTTDGKEQKQGLFRDMNGTIKNLTLAGTINGSGYTYVGGFMGYGAGTLINCVNEATVIGKANVGGIAGQLQNGSVINCINKGAVTAENYGVGGIVGLTNGRTGNLISNCANYGYVNCIYAKKAVTSIAGILGTAGGIITIENSFNAGKVEAVNGSVAAIVGTNYASAVTDLVINNTFNTGKINGNVLVVGTYSVPNEGKALNKVSIDTFYDIANPDATIVSSDMPGDKALVTNTYILNKKVTADTILSAYAENSLYSCEAGDGYDYPDFRRSENVSVSYNCDLGGIFKIGNTEDGSALNPWIIDSAEKFVALFGEESDGAKLKDHFIQTEDIKLPESYRAYGQADSYNASKYKYFSGVYDGNGHSIEISMRYEGATGATFAGVFSVNRGTIKNLKVTGYIDVPEGSYIGGVSGWNYGRIENCINSANINAKGTVGGITGKQENSNLTELMSGCINTGNIIGLNGGAGGIIGDVNCAMTIINCANYGEITSNSRTGGIIGTARVKIVIKNCFNAGTVNSLNKRAAAIIGNTSTGKNTYVEISDCFNTGKINGLSYANGLAFGTINNSNDYCYRFIIKDLYDVSETVVAPVFEGDEYVYSDVFILGRNDVTKEDIINHFANKEGWAILDGYEYPQLISNPYFKDGINK